MMYTLFGCLCFGLAAILLASEVVEGFSKEEYDTEMAVVEITAEN